MFDTELIGQTLLKRGFKAFFLYLFNVIEGRKFIVEPLHRQLFDYFQNIYDGKVQRCNINICPRSAKTTLAQYFLVYTITINPKAQIIYTSYSQSLLSEISSKIVSILENPIYKALYPHNTSNVDKEELNPVDDFWKNYLFDDTGKNVYSSKIIKTYAGGLCLFNSIGASITGYGAGLRNSKKFSGCLIIDDANKPADVRSQTMRNRVLRYFEETLLSRLNNPDTPIINIQQRLHVEDLSGILADKYNFDVLRIPLLDDNGNCLIPSQYTQERIKELKINNYMFQAQYMQSPIIAEGEVINPNWFTYYPIDVDYNYDKIVISADTAMTVKEASDYTCFIVGGVTKDNKLHILEVVHGKFEYPVLRQQAIDLYNRWQRDVDHASASAMFIENKASGISLIQDLKTAGLPVIPIDVTKDKLARVEEVLNYIATGLVMLPVNKTYGTNPELLAECQAFTRDDSHLHDDIVDGLCHLINNTIAHRQISLLDVL